MKKRVDLGGMRGYFQICRLTPSVLCRRPESSGPRRTFVSSFTGGDYADASSPEFQAHKGVDRPRRSGSKGSQKKVRPEGPVRASNRYSLPGLLPNLPGHSVQRLFCEFETRLDTYI